MVRRSVSGSAAVRAAPWAALAVGLATTAVLWGTIHRAWSARRAQDFATAQKDVLADVDAAVERQVAILHSTAGLIAANPNLTQAQFTTYFQNLRFGGELPVPQAIGYSVWRPWAQRDDLAREAVRRGVAGFRLRPLAPRSEAHAVVLIAPLDQANRAAPGYDMHAEPTRRQAMDAALGTRAAAMTSRVALAKDDGKDIPSVLLYLPVFDKDGRKPLGFVYCGLHAQDLFASLFPRPLDGGPQSPLRRGVGLRMWSGDPTDRNLLYDNGVPGPGEALQNLRFRLKAVPESLTVRFVATSEFGSPSVILPTIPPIGILISLLLFLVALTLRNESEASERRAAEQALLAFSGRLAFDNANDDALATLAREAAATLGAICRVDLLEADGSLRTVNTREGQTDLLAELERTYPRIENDGLLIRALESGKTQRASEPATRSDSHRVLVERLGIGPVVVTPMMVRGRAIGALTLSRYKGRPPLQPDAVAIVEAVADRIALAVDNARLYRAAQQEIQERRLAEAEVRRLNDGLEEIVAERTRDLEASNHELESFCYSVSHDLRTPLRSLDGFGRALKEDYGDALDGQAHDYIDRIRAATRRMDELITALLTLSRLTRREIVPAQNDVSELARETMADLDPQGRVALAVEPGLRVQADPRMLQVALENLLGNAIKFTGRTEDPCVEVGKAADGAIFVRDNGAGFDPAYANKLFMPFERLHSVREFPGHGIGLATVERILRRHGGSVRAEGKTGEGATFFIKFPE